VTWHPPPRASRVRPFKNRKFKQHSIMSCLYLRFLDGLDAGRKAGGGGRLSLPGWRTGRQPDLVPSSRLLRFFDSSYLGY